MSSLVSLTLSAAKKRGAQSFFTDLHSPPNQLRVCRGTSCMLAGADCHVGGRGVYCVGYCDRSPAALAADDSVVIHGSTPPPSPSIRCAAKEPIVTSRIGRGDFCDLAAARADGAYAAVEQAMRRRPAEVLQAVIDSGERGRGGAGFPTGAKWRTCAQTSAEHRYVVANGDEGDPGSFIDRVLMEQDPHAVIEGMLLCAHAVRADRGVVFIRSEYPRAIAVMKRAIEQAKEAGLLGDFDVSVFAGMGSYVCGEETAMLSTIEGGRGEVRLRPPYPAEAGLFGCPTVVNNVETLSNVPWIVRRGAVEYRRRGTADSPGTKAICLNHGFARPGIVEVEFGVSLRDVIEKYGGGGAGGRRIEAVILGGPMGNILTQSEWDVPVCYEQMRRRGIELGHGGLVALPEGTDYRALLVHILAFMQHESCGKCVPCRLGSKRAMDIARVGSDDADAHELSALLDVIGQTSLCAFGQLIPRPARRLIELFGERMGLSGRPPAGAHCE